MITLVFLGWFLIIIVHQWKQEWIHDVALYMAAVPGPQASHQLNPPLSLHLFVVLPGSMETRGTAAPMVWWCEGKDWVFTSGAGATRREQVTVSQASSYNQLLPTTGKPHTMMARCHKGSGRLKPIKYGQAEMTEVIFTHTVDDST